MVTQQLTEARTDGVMVTDHNIEQIKETTMNTNTMARPTGGTWFRRASAGLAGLALVGALGFGLANGITPGQDRVESTVPAAAGLADGYRDAKAQQAEGRADAATSMLAPASRSIPETFRRLKDQQLAQRLDGDAAPVAEDAVPAASPQQRYGAMKDRQADERADARPVRGGAAVAATGDAYRQFKEQQIDARLAREDQMSKGGANIPERYRLLKDRQWEQRLASQD